jgi:hypothetical protein
MVYRQISDIKSDFKQVSSGENTTSDLTEFEKIFEKERHLVDGRVDLMMFSLNKVQDTAHEVQL